MAKEIIAMSKKEIDRLRILHRIMDKQMSQVYGAKLLGISDRQIRTLLHKIGTNGDKGIVHGNRGHRAPNKMSGDLEKARRIMIAKGLWKVRRKRQRDVHRRRERKHYFGEMVQFDGSHHRWLEDRGPKMVFMGLRGGAT